MVTAEVYFKRRTVNRLTRVVEGKIPNLSEHDCVAQQAMLATILGPDGEDITLAMDHGDIKPDNIIVDMEYNVKGYGQSKDREIVAIATSN